MSCSCDQIMANTGALSCQAIQKVTAKHYLVPVYDSTGAENKISEADFTAGKLTKAFIDGKVNHVDPSQRWYPVHGIYKNVTEAKNEDIDETFNDGSIANVAEGALTFDAFLLGLGKDYVGQLKPVQCTEIGVYIVDIPGSIYGQIEADGNLYPAKIQKESFKAKAIPATDTTVQKIQVTFTFSRSVKDEKWGYVLAENIETNMLTINGLVDVVLKGDASTTATNIVFAAYSPTKELGKQVMYTGRVLADFVFYNKTTSSSVVPTLLTELASGIYSATVTAQTSADEVTISGAVGQNLGKWLIPTTVVIP